jgi:ribosome-binding protein aMBF1 (putative translation factor)
MTLLDFTVERRAEITRDVRSDDPRTMRPAMRAARMSIADAARATGLDYSRLERVLNGRARARPEETRKLADLLGVSTIQKARVIAVLLTEILPHLSG